MTAATLSAEERSEVEAVLANLRSVPRTRYVGRGPWDWMRKWVGRIGGHACIALAVDLWRVGVIPIEGWAALISTGLRWAAWWERGLWAPVPNNGDTA